MYSINLEMNKIFKVLSYKTRTDILQEIQKDSGMTLSSLARKFKMSKQTLEFHVNILKNVGLLQSRRKNGSVCLNFKPQKIQKAYRILEKLFG
ncbi:MAG: winged helix-turn-helix domain-containing protein [Alphaproteobacteria bacterium]